MSSDPLATSPTLLHRVRSLNDGEAWRIFHNRYGAFMLNVCHKKGLASSEAEDVVGEVYCKLVETLATFQYDAKVGLFRNWLALVVSRTTIDHWRRQQQLPVMVGCLEQLRSPVPFPGEPDPEESPQSEHSLRIEEATLAVRVRLGEMNWEIFQRVAVNGEEPCAVAENLNLALGAVYQRCYRVRKALRDALAELAAHQ